MSQCLTISEKLNYFCFIHHHWKRPVSRILQPGSVRESEAIYDRAGQTLGSKISSAFEIYKGVMTLFWLIFLRYVCFVLRETFLFAAYHPERRLKQLETMFSDNQISFKSRYLAAIFMNDIISVSMVFRNELWLIRYSTYPPF